MFTILINGILRVSRLWNPLHEAVPRDHENVRVRIANPTVTKEWLERISAQVRVH